MRGATKTKLVFIGTLVVAILVLCLAAPTERTMGHAQRILYIHVPMAWLALIGLPIMAGCGVAYLVRRTTDWDFWAQAAGELGWLCCSLTLVTGSLWARQAWGTWWEWDPRLTSAFVLWVIYSGTLLVRSGVDDNHRRARVGAVLATLGTLDIPLVILATRWFRGIHPVAPEMDSTMRVTLILCVLGFSVLFAFLISQRRTQLQLRLAEANRIADTIAA